MSLNLIMLGPPGAGKGTQSERLARTRGIPTIATGDILREAVHAGTEIGRRARAIMDRGELVSDDVMIGIVRERLERPDALGGFILDGFPRTVAQAIALDEIMQGRDPLMVIEIAVPEPELVRRLGTRLICQDCGINADIADRESASGDRLVTPASGAGAETTAARDAMSGHMRCRRCGGVLVQRSDDSDEVVLERLKVYRANTQPLVDFYGSRPTFRAINGAQPPDRVASDITAAIDGVGGDGVQGVRR